MSLSPKPHIRALSVATHGGIDYAELARLGLDPDDILDFSVNTNPFGPPPGAHEALAVTTVDRYPDSETMDLRKLLAERHGVDAANVLVTNGSVEAIWAASLAYLGPGDSALICGPTFGEYEVASRVAGADVAHLDAGEEDCFQPDLHCILSFIAERKPRVVFLCNPNNPTGSYLARDAIEAILAVSPECLVVLDEAYVDFVLEAWSSPDLIGGANLLILRSMTKDFSLAGLRLGYALAHAEIIADLRKVRPPWSVNAPAQAAGMAALRAAGFLESSMAGILEAKDYLVGELRRLGFPILDSRANFFLVKVGDAAHFRSALLARKLLVRNCASFGLPGYVRIAPRQIEDCRRLVREVEEHVGRSPGAG